MHACSLSMDIYPARYTPNIVTMYERIRTVNLSKYNPIVTL